MAADNHKPTDNLSDPRTWVDQHGDYLFRYAYKRVRNEGVAQDLVQETFLAALKAAGSFKGQSAEKTWLVGILKNKVIDHFRKAGREVDFDLEDPSELQDDVNFQTGGAREGMWRPDRRPADWQVDAHDRAERSEFWEYLLACLDELDHRHSLVFVLREMEELPSPEVCNVLGLKPTNLRVMLYRARQQLRRCLEHNWVKGTERP